MHIKLFLIFLAFVVALTSCASYDFSRRIVQQGNLLPQTTTDRLKIGMTKDDAAILVGTSLLSPTFNNDRWDYAYTWHKGNRPIEVRNLSLYFSQGRLTRIEHHP